MRGTAAPRRIQDDEQAVFATIAAGAAEADTGHRDLSADMALLATSGILRRLCAVADPADHVDLLRRIGAASLPVGRLAEGHMNAMRLIAIYGTPAQRRAHAAEALNGRVYGVWGADDDPPVELRVHHDGRLILTGSKRFASGLKIVSRAILPVGTPEGPRLVITNVADARRADQSVWQTSGMRATVSGRYDFDGLEAEPLGGAGDYLREPYFQGGVWRYAAVHVGGLEALAEAVRRAVRGFGDAANEAQLHRVARVAGLAHGARLFVTDAACRVEAPSAGEEEVALSLAARETVETACLEAMALADRALGTRSFVTGHPVDLLRRDLGFFLRQADLDGKLRRVGRTLCESRKPIGAIWSD